MSGYVTIFNTETGRVKYIVNNAGEYEEKEDGVIVELEDNETVVYGGISADYKLDGTDLIPIPEEELASEYTEEQIRKQRNTLLTESDWTALSDSDLSDEKKEEWKTYRQSLRDITSNAKFPALLSSDWPTKPT